MIEQLKQEVKDRLGIDIQVLPQSKFTKLHWIQDCDSGLVLAVSPDPKYLTQEDVSEVIKDAELRYQVYLKYKDFIKDKCVVLDSLFGIETVRYNEVEEPKLAIPKTILLETDSSLYILSEIIGFNIPPEFVQTLDYKSMLYNRHTVIKLQGTAYWCLHSCNDNIIYLVETSEVIQKGTDTFNKVMAKLNLTSY